MTDLAGDEKIGEAVAALTPEEKARLLTGRDFWTTWPIEKIGLRRMLVSGGPSGVRGEVWDERDPDDGSALVMLGVRPLGAMQSFSPLGWETFITPVSWVDGWPQPEPVQLAPRADVDKEVFDFADPAALDDPGWMAVRATPVAVACLVDGRLSIIGRVGLDDSHPAFVGRPQRHLITTASTTIDASAGVGGLAVRYDEHHWYGLEARGSVVTARAHVAGFGQSWDVTVPAGDVELRIEMARAAPGFTDEAMGADRIRLYAGGTLLTELDGRYWTSEMCASFTGLMIGLYASEGTVAFADFRYSGTEGESS